MPIKYTQAISLSRSSHQSDLLLFAFAAILLQTNVIVQMKWGRSFFFALNDNTATVNRKYRTKRRGKLNDAREFFFSFCSMKETNSMWNKTHLHSMWLKERNDICIHKTTSVWENLYLEKNVCFHHDERSEYTFSDQFVFPHSFDRLARWFFFFGLWHTEANTLFDSHVLYTITINNSSSSSNSSSDNSGSSHTAVSPRNTAVCVYFPNFPKVVAICVKAKEMQRHTKIYYWNCFKNDCFISFSSLVSFWQNNENYDEKASHHLRWWADELSIGAVQQEWNHREKNMGIKRMSLKH